MYLVDIQTSNFAAEKLNPDHQAQAIRTMHIYHPITRTYIPVGQGTLAPANSLIVVGTLESVEVSQCEALEVVSVETAHRTLTWDDLRTLITGREICWMLGLGADIVDLAIIITVAVAQSSLVS